jgi:hypothetical protein
MLHYRRGVHEGKLAIIEREHVIRRLDAAQELGFDSALRV